MNKETKIPYNEVIKSTSSNQHEILYNIMRLHNNNKGFYCDMTYSSGKFYEQDKNFFIPQPKVKLDVFPQKDEVIKIEPLGKLPFEDNSIPSIVIDLPFIIAPKDSASTKKEGKEHNIIQKRFASYYPKEEMFESYHHWINEAYRVLNRGGGLNI